MPCNPVTLCRDLRIFSVIFEVANPSGKLPLTFLSKLDDIQAFKFLSSGAGVVVCGGDILGYRCYEVRNIEVAFPLVPTSAIV